MCNVQSRLKCFTHAQDPRMFTVCSKPVPTRRDDFLRVGSLAQPVPCDCIDTLTCAGSGLHSLVFIGKPTRPAAYNCWLRYNLTALLKR